MELLTALALILGLVLAIAACIGLVVAAYCFVEEAFHEHLSWGLGLVVPVALYVCHLIAATIAPGWFALPRGPSLLLFGLEVAVVLGVGLALLVRRWPQFRGYVGAMGGSAAYLAVWVVLMIQVVVPAAGLRA